VANGKQSHSLIGITMSDDSKSQPLKKGGIKDLANALQQKLENKTKVALFTHKFPDPDAIGSMMGLNALLNRKFHLEAELFFDGEISHPQNIAISNLLDPQLKPVSDYIPANFDLRILLDTIPINAGVGNHKVDFDVVIDHHKDLPNGGYNGLVIHLKTGSCCSIVFKLIESLCDDGVFFEDDNDADSKVATAMIAGVVTDTEYMVSDDSTELEFDTFSKLFPYRNSNFLKQIVFFKRPRFWIDIKAKAATAADIDEDGYAIVGLGLIPESQRDIISDMAEEMISWASVETAIAFAVVGGVRIEGSVRSLNPSVSVSDFCKRLGGRFGVGGGKLGKGAYRYDLSGMSIDPDEDEEIRRKTCDLIREKEIKRIQRMIRK
jgi:nanoRNase/pAp phosphatase (c-di-AMP/oligoRNAs hydrolase)